MFPLESPHGGDSNEYRQYTVFNIKKKNHIILSHLCSQGSFSEGLNEPSVFEPLKFYCIAFSGKGGSNN